MKMPSFVSLLIVVFILCFIQYTTPRYIQQKFSDRDLASPPAINDINEKGLDIETEISTRNRDISKHPVKDDDDEKKDYELESFTKKTHRKSPVKRKQNSRKNKGKLVMNKLRDNILRSQKSNRQGTLSLAVGKNLRPSVNVFPGPVINQGEFVGAADAIDQKNGSLLSTDKESRTMDSTRDQKFIGQSLAEISASASIPNVSFIPTNLSHPDHLPPPGIVFGTGNIPSGMESSSVVEFNPEEKTRINGTVDYLPLSPQVSDPFHSPDVAVQEATMTSSTAAIPVTTSQATQWFWPDGHNTGPLQAS